jgi:hypothetical protein
MRVPTRRDVSSSTSRRPRGDARSASAERAAAEDEWWAEHLVLAGLVRCTLASMTTRRGVPGSTRPASERARRRHEARRDGLYAFVDIETTLEVELARARSRRAAASSSRRSTAASSRTR